MAAFFDTLAKFEDVSETDGWRVSLFRQDSSELDVRLVMYGFPESGFVERLDYQFWKRDWYRGLRHSIQVAEDSR